MSSSASSSSASSSASEYSSSESDNDFDDLLQAALASARAKGKSRAQVDELATNDSVILLDDADEVPDIQIDQPASAPVASTSSKPLPAHVTNDRFGQLPRKKLSKSQRKELQPKTAGGKWFDLPAAPAVPSAELKREISALKLGTAIDRKRFLKGEAKKSAGKMPEYFQMGHIMPSNHPASTESRGAGKAGKKRSFVEALADDHEVKSYTKKKFSEVQTRGASGGKGYLKQKQKDKYGRKASAGDRRR